MKAVSKVKIGDWLLEADLNQMSNGARTIYLGALKTRLLGFLAGNPGRVVDRDELAHEVWGGFASDHTITQHIAVLRKHMSSDTDKAYIQTVPKRGYRLIAPVSGEPVSIRDSIQEGMDLANIRVAVVDDSDFVNDYLGSILSGIGLESVATFLSAEAALEAFKAVPFDLVLCDVVMGPMNGLELIKQIRTGTTGLDPFTAVIIMTSFAETDVLGSAILLDVNGFVSKPLDVGTLRDKLIHALTEDFQYRPSLAYRHIDVSFVDRIDVTGRGRAAVLVDRERSSGDGSFRRVNVNELTEGMVLAAPLRAVDGSLILPAGTGLSRTNILRLREIAPSVLSSSDIDIA